MMRRLTPVLAALCLLQWCPASILPPEVVNPRAYASPSGRYRLEVDPSQIHGEGSARYRLTRDSVEIWSGTRPVTFIEAAVTDDGVAAGYGYTGGLQGLPNRGQFHVAIFAPDGGYRLDHRVTRTDSQFLHAPPNPIAAGLIVDPASDRLIVRVHDADLNRGQEEFWNFRLSDGRSTGVSVPIRNVPAASNSRLTIAARLVPGTPLILAQFWHYSNTRELKPGARFVLFDQQYRPVWVLTRDDDYPTDELRRAMHRDGGLLPADQPRQFALRFGRENARVTFEVSEEPGREGQWNVRELSREPYVEPPPATRPSSQPAEPIELRRLGTITLRRSSGPIGPIHDVHRMAMDGTGRIGFLRHEQDRGMSFVLVDEDGRVIREVRPEGFGGEDRTGETLAWISGSRWLLADAPFGPGAKLRAWWIDVDQGSVQLIAALDCPAISAAAGTGDGGFAVLVNQHERATIIKGMIAFDSAGARRWSVGTDYGDPQKLFSPEDITFTTDRRIAVLENPGDCIKFFSKDGGYLSTTDLKRAFGADPNYPADLHRSADGGVLVHDFNGSVPLWWLDRRGQVRAKLEPAYSDGRKINLRGFGTAPSGEIWVSDGQALLRLNSRGVVDRVVGTAPNPDLLGEISAIAVDRGGKIYAVDANSASVHVFDDQGAPLRALKPGPGDFPSNSRITEIDVSPDGHVYLGDDGGRLHFRPDGTRVGKEKLGIDPITERRFFGPTPERSWAIGYREAFLLDAAGKVLRKIDRRPDRFWLADPHDVAVAPDGSAAIWAADILLGRNEPTISLYSPEGEPIRTLRPPIGGIIFSMAYTGRWVIVPNESDLYFIDAESNRIRRFTFERSRSKSYWWVFHRPGAGEIWLWETDTASLQRFAVPEG